jgi:hypothetical protein
MRKSLLLAASTLLMLTSCGGGNAGIGEACSKDSDCGDSTQCIPNGGQQISNSELTCVESDTLCSIPCAKDADCSSLGEGYICIDDCFQGSCLKGSRS